MVSQWAFFSQFSSVLLFGALYKNIPGASLLQNPLVKKMKYTLNDKNIEVT